MSAEKLTISRTFKDSRERVFDAFTKKDAIQAWYGPEGFTVPSVTIDPKPGGKKKDKVEATV